MMAALIVPPLSFSGQPGSFQGLHLSYRQPVDSHNAGKKPLDAALWMTSCFSSVVYRHRNVKFIVGQWLELIHLLFHYPDIRL